MNKRTMLGSAPRARAIPVDPGGRAMPSKALLAFLLVFALGACGDHAAAPAKASVFKSTDITGIGWGVDFHLTDQTGQPRNLADFKGKAVMLYFGYTHCPDMCPTALSQMAQVRARQGAEADHVQGLFVTIDPERDSGDVLARYVKAFDPSFLGLRADPATTAALAKEFKVYFSHGKVDAQGNYPVEHMGGVFVFDPRGRLRLLMMPGTDLGAMANDVSTLLKENA
ncbi:MAG: SCO family protein [Pseudomonadota bacterium]|nr:SCO family protein [Pseudomonadota bacterium]